MRKEVRNPPMSLVVVPVHPVALGTSPEFVYRAAASTDRSTAFPSRPPP
jgi:hypothetical protein